VFSIIYGILAAISWGGGDFSGGLASRRVGAYRAVFLSEVLGLGFLLVVLAIFREGLPSTWGLIFAMGVGAFGSISLLILYKAMEIGKMSIAAPISALLAAALPVVVGAMYDGMPKISQFAGFGLALAAVWLISQVGEGGKPHIQSLADLRLPLLAGIGFGTYFIIIHRVAQESTLWPMIASRTGGTIMLAAVVLGMRRESLKIPRGEWPLVTLCGILDVGGNFFYILASQSGRLDISAVLSSLYPGVTALLAWVLLKEHISNTQRVGIIIALGSIVLMTI
jgi:drug/metabolite transporter (DMT)-like permease